MSTNERTGERTIPHPRIVANEMYLANPDIVRVRNPDFDPVNETRHWYGSKSSSSHVLPDGTLVRRF